MEAALSALFEKIFFPLLSPIFGPINSFLSMLDRFTNLKTIIAVGFFVGTMIWVGVLLDKNYVNRGLPTKALWRDLRLWTVISMLPHVFVYIYFR